jgi:amino acid permease
MDAGTSGKELREGLVQPADAPAEERKSSIIQSSFTLANACIGSGILSFPFAFLQAGAVNGALLFLAFSVLLGFALHIIVHCLCVAQRQDRSIKTYEALVEFCGGPRLGLFMEVTMTIYLFGATLAMQIIMGDSAVPLLRLIAHQCNASEDVKALFASTAFVTSAICVLILFPLCLARSLHHLRHFSTFAVCSVGYMVVMVTLEYFGVGKDASPTLLPTPYPTLHPDASHYSGGGGGGGGRAYDESHAGTPTDLYATPSGRTIVLFHFGSSLFMAFPIFVYALGCHLNAPHIYAAMDQSVRTVANFDKVIAAAYGIAVLFYVPTGLLGYLSFGENTPQDILSFESVVDPVTGLTTASGYSMDNSLADVARGAILFNTW